MRRLGLILLFIVLALLVLLFVWLGVRSRQHGAARFPYDPAWQTGDDWKVQFSVQLAQRPKMAPARTIFFTHDVLYEYQVTAEFVENGRDVIQVSVKTTEAGWPEWLLTFDKDETTLVAVEEILVGGTSIRYESPFGRDAWMAALDQYNFIAIHDFPKIPVNQANEVRTLSSNDGATPDFMQDVHFQNDEVEVLMERTDPVTGDNHQTRILWEKGKPWWKEATIKLGNDVKVSGKLL